MTGTTDFRNRMVDLQLVRRGIADPAVLAAMRKVPRELFVDEALRDSAYDDAPLRIGEGQTISQPYIVARMIEAARLKPGSRALEIGTGSGYAAAVMAEIGAQVITLERLRALVERARRALQQAGYGNVEVHQADGTLGWHRGAPFDAIIAAAGGPSIPDVWLRQLAVGGTLVMPVGHQRHLQRLLQVTRTSEARYQQEDLGAVTFVPLIGANGWSGDDEGRLGEEPGQASGTMQDGKSETQPAAVAPGTPLPLARRVAGAARPLPDIDDEAFAEVIDTFAGRRVVLLGEASHGTSEFYRARAAITRRLIERHGFNLVAVEADWPDAAIIDRHVRDRPIPSHPETSNPPFQRFPTWMWRNAEFADFVEWLRGYNAVRPVARRAGFFGLDIYGMNASISAVLRYLESVDAPAAAQARERYSCLAPWREDPAAYGHAVLSGGYQKCEEDVISQLRALLEKRLQYMGTDPDAFFDAAQNARMVAAAERYYRVMYWGSAASWNLRDTHMFETLRQLLQRHGEAAKAVVWAHNSHIGNAAATAMGRRRGELNIGQLCREHFGNAAGAIGFGTDHGTVAAASDWDGPMEIKRVLPSREDSYERIAHDSGVPRFFLDLRDGGREGKREGTSDSGVRAALMPPRQERFIGVIYRPETEFLSHYAEASLPEQFDAWIWFDETRAVEALRPSPSGGTATDVPETYPFGL